MQAAPSNDTLAHYGILGMKWGVRRTPEQLGHGRSGGKRSSKGKSLSKEEQEANNQKRRSTALKSNKASDLRKGMDRLTDDELRTRINRINMEMQVKELERRQRPRVQQEIEAILREVGKETVKSAIRDTVRATTRATAKAISNQTKKRRK